MRVFLTVLILIFSFQSLTRADDIREFELEGMSIGDSLLDHFSEEKIKNPDDIYKYKESDKFYHIIFNSIGKYDNITFTIKKNDTSYKIYQVGGDINTLKIQDCHNLKKEIDKEIVQMFENNVERHDIGSFKTSIDKTGKSLFYTIQYIFNSQDLIVLQCKDYSEEIGHPDSLLLDIATKEFNEWLSTEVYKY